jgi:hypothetical protein
MTASEISHDSAWWKKAQDRVGTLLSPRPRLIKAVKLKKNKNNKKKGLK